MFDQHLLHPVKHSNYYRNYFIKICLYLVVINYLNTLKKIIVSPPATLLRRTASPDPGTPHGRAPRRGAATHRRAPQAFLLRSVPPREFCYPGDVGWGPPCPGAGAGGGRIFDRAGADVAVMLPLLERAGHRIRRVPHVLHVYNVATPLNDFKVHLQEVAAPRRPAPRAQGPELPRAARPTDRAAQRPCAAMGRRHHRAGPSAPHAAPWRADRRRRPGRYDPRAPARRPVGSLGRPRPVLVRPLAATLPAPAWRSLAATCT